MKIAIEALGIHSYGGGRSATLHLLEALFAIDHKNQYTVFLTQSEPSLKSSAGNVQQQLVPFKNRFLARLWAQAILPFRTRKYDLIHFIKNLGVFGISIPNIVTIYDLTTVLHPDLFPASDVLYWRTVQRATLQQATKIVAISMNTAQDIQNYYGISQEKIRIIYPAQAAHFYPPSETDVARVKEKYHLSGQYILHVGRIDRKKNIPLLIEAFAGVKNTLPPGVRLVLAGEVYHKARDSRLEALLASEQHDQIVLTGPVPDRDLPGLYAGAHVAVFSSRHEGFGIVALEALACGVPLITSKAGAVGEAVGQAALVLDNPTAKDLELAIQRLWFDTALREKMIHQGIRRAADFSWQRSAKETLDLYQEVGSK